MAFFLGLAAVPFMMYGGWEMGNAIEDICTFNYSQYLTNKNLKALV